MKISKRLKNVATLIDNDSSIIDVGCDHALLDIYLALNKNIKKIIASDNKKGPLLKAKENISFYNLENVIKTKLGDGLDTIEDDIDTIVITGMGGNNIINILEKGNLSNINSLVLSPQSEIPEVRKYLMNKNYIIEKELIVKDKKKYYFIIKFIKGNISYNEKELLFGPYLLKNRNDIFYEYLNEEIVKMNSVLRKVPDNKDIIKYIEMIDEIKKY